MLWRKKKNRQKSASGKAAGKGLSLGPEELRKWLNAVSHLGVTPMSTEWNASQYATVLLVEKYPQQWVISKLQELQNIGVRLRLKLVMTPLGEEFWNSSKARQLNRLTAELGDTDAKSAGYQFYDASIDRAAQGLQQLKHEQDYYGKEVLDTWFFVTVLGDTERQLWDGERRVRSILGKAGVKVNPLRYLQKEAFISALSPTLIHPALKAHYPGYALNQRHASALNMFTGGSTSDGRGPYFGLRTSGDAQTMFIDMDRGTGGQNGLINGSTGAGKSNLLKAIILGLLLEGHRVVVFDLDGEFFPLCQAVGGLWVDHTTAAGVFCDPMTIYKVDVPPWMKADGKEDDVLLEDGYSAMAGTMRRFVSLLARRNLDEMEIAVADATVQRTAADAGVSRLDPNTWERPLSVHNWYRTLAAVAETRIVLPEFLALKDEVAAVATRLRMLLHSYFDPAGVMANVFSRPKRLDFGDYPLVVIHESRDKKDPVAAAKIMVDLPAVLAALKQNRAANKGYMDIAVDEFQSLAESETAMDFLGDLNTTIRKWNGSMWFASNVPETLFTHSGGGMKIWNNTRHKVFMRMEEATLKTLAEKGRLPEHVQDQIRHLPSGDDAHWFVLRRGEGVYETLEMTVGAEEQKLYETRGVGR